MLSDGNVWYDTSGLKSASFGIASLCETLTDRRLVFGSLYPLQSLRSTLYLITRTLWGMRPWRTS